MGMLRILGAGASALALSIAVASAAEPPPNSARVIVGPVQVEWTAESLGNETVQAALRYLMGWEPPAAADDVRPGVYWLGLRCEPLPAALRSQLGLKEEGGLLVTSLLPDSPAKNAGLEEHDVLMKIGKEPLRRPAELATAVEEAQGAELTLSVIRGGKPRQVKVTPAKRPEMAAAEPMARLSEGETARLQRWLDETMPGWQNRLPMRLQYLRPGQIVPPGAVAAPLPDDLAVVVTRRGKEPAKIVVEKGSQRWELSEKELDKLPAEVRPHVERMLHPLAQGWSVRVGDWTVQPPGEVRDRVERQMNEVRRQMDEVRKQLEEMRSRMPVPPVEPKKDEPKREKSRL